MTALVDGMTDGASANPLPGVHPHNFGAGGAGGAGRGCTIDEPLQAAIC